MNPVLSELAAAMQSAAQSFIPKAFLAGKQKAGQKYGVTLTWNQTDQAAIQLLLARHAQEVLRSMTNAELRIAEGASLLQEIENFIGRVGSWSWVLSPAMAMGMSTYVDQNRTEIARREDLPANDIGVIWLTAEDEKVCPKCLFLAGRWFDARTAYDIAGRIHPNCRCPAHFDVGTPAEAMVGPIPGYQSGTAEDIYRDLGNMTNARIRRVRNINARGTPSNYARPDVKL